MFDTSQRQSMVVTGAALAVALLVAIAVHVAIEPRARAASAKALDFAAQKIPTVARGLIARSGLFEIMPVRRDG
jgi:hypothetical protein